MGSSQNDPILRNRFFHGKMLTAGDLQLEQDYFNQKRQMLNRLLYGSGVVAGLSVQVQDDLQMVKIMPGVALDSLGREILVSQVETCLLTALPGFAAVAGSDAPFYLCVSYTEQAVHRAAASQGLLAAPDPHLAKGEPGYVAEGYRFSVTGQAPEDVSQGSMPVVYVATLQGQMVNGVYRIGEVFSVQSWEQAYNSPLLLQMGTGGQAAGGGAQSVAEPVAESVAESTPESVVAVAEEPVAESTPEPVSTVAVEPVATIEEPTVAVEPPAEVSAPKLVATGTVSVSLGSSKMFLAPFNKFVERSFYTEVLEHGLGPGPVCMTIGVEDSRSEGTFYGDLDVFEDTVLKPKYPDFAMGVVVFPHDGTFKIGLKVKQQTDRESIELRWWAYKETGSDQK